MSGVAGVTGAELDAALGRVIGSLPGGGEDRRGQREMAHGVLAALESGRHYAVRAGTGTGKSVAYLVPALLSGKRVLVATATKALQEQLARNDLPLVAAVIGRRVRYAVLKGRSNYLCRQRLVESASRGTQGQFTPGQFTPGQFTQGQLASGATEGRRDGSLGAEAAAVAEWASTTKTGDVGELDFEPDARVWSAFSVSAGECPGAHRCPSGADCYAEGARARAAAADLVVVNQHLLGAHLASGDMVLPEHDLLIVDEAHELEEVMSRSLGVSVSPGRLRAAAVAARAAAGRNRPSGLEEAAASVEDAALRLDVFLGQHAGERVGRGQDDLGDLLGLIGGRLERLERELAAVVSAADSSDRAAEPGRAALGTSWLREEVLGVLDPGDSVVWVERGTRPTLEVAPLDVATVLGPRVFGQHPVVLTSATLPPGIAPRLGAEGHEVDEVDVGSPFAFDRNALLYCAAHLPDPRSPGAADALLDELGGLIDAAGGRTLALFTSWRAMNRAAEVLRPRVGHPIVVQGEGSKAEVVRRFTEDEATCLFATMSFWQGLDVPGPTLSLVTIDRLPFPSPDDPLLLARRERAGPGAFGVIDLPRAASLLAQGAGRLIRTATDRGVVAVLDSRLASASYRRQLLAALPPMRRTIDPAEVRAFLGAISGEAVLTDR